MKLLKRVAHLDHSPINGATSKAVDSIFKISFFDMANNINFNFLYQFSLKV